jgi:uncharacterized RmlC-like cupin family protein
MDSVSCRVIRGDSGYRGKQGLNYFAGIGAQNAGAKHLCLHVLVIPAGGRARAHLHENHESAIYLVQGEVDVWWGEQLREHARMQGGDFMYIPPGVPHVPVNASATQAAEAVIARTDPNEQESVVLLPELDALLDSGALPHPDTRRGP